MLCNLKKKKKKPFYLRHDALSKQWGCKRLTVLDYYALEGSTCRRGPLFWHWSTTLLLSLRRELVDCHATVMVFQSAWYLSVMRRKKHSFLLLLLLLLLLFRSFVFVFVLFLLFVYLFVCFLRCCVFMCVLCCCCWCWVVVVVSWWGRLFVCFSRMFYYVVVGFHAWGALSHSLPSEPERYRNRQTEE